MKIKKDYTPGPWEINPRKSDLDVIISKDLNLQARSNGPCSEFRAMEANARLISAAPDLVDALIEYMENATHNEWPLYGKEYATYVKSKQALIKAGVIDESHE